MADQKKQENEWISWGLIIFLFIIGLSPVALILLLVKLFGDDEKKIKTAADGAKTAAQSAASGAKQAKSAVKRMTKSPATKRSTAKWLKIGGLILAAAGLIACVEPVDMMIWLGKAESYYLEDLLAALMMIIGGGAMWISGRRMDRRLKRYAKYLAVMGDRDAVSLEELSRTLGHSQRQVEKDLQQMIDRGYFGGKAYLHVEKGCLFRSGDADAARENRQKEVKRAETSPFIMVKALYSCSVKMALTIWCENVILEREIFESALLYTASENPYAPPMMKTMSFPTYDILS